MTRALVVCAHGTDNPQGQAVVRSIVAQVARRRPDLTVREAYVDVQQPELPHVVNELAAHHDSVVVVPLLLSSGFHTEVDVAQAVAAHPHAHAAPALGPHALLAKVLVDRLVDAGATLDASVVLAVAGSSRAAGATDAERMRELLAERWAGTVALGYLSARQPSVADAVRVVAAEHGGDPSEVVVASYLIGPGFFHDRLGGLGARVSAPLGDDPRLAELVLRRFEGVFEGVDS